MSASFQEVIDANYQNLYRYAVSISGSANDAWDLTQETFLIWARKGSGIRNEKATKSWLYTTLYREFLKKARRSSRLVGLEDSQYEEETAEVDSSEYDSIDADLAIQLLLQLKLEYRKVVSLFYLESYTYKEIASILDIPIGTVMSRLARGKELLKKQLRNADRQNNNVINFSEKERKSQHG